MPVTTELVVIAREIGIEPIVIISSTLTKYWSLEVAFIAGLGLAFVRGAIRGEMALNFEFS